MAQSGEGWLDARLKANFKRCNAFGYFFVGTVA